MIDDRVLVDKILSGDTDTFRSLIDQYQRLVTHIVFKMIARDSEREDICQDVFIKIYQNLPNFKFESKLSTWIAKITYNRCINYLEKKKIPLYEDIASGDEIINSYSDDNITPEKFAETRDTYLHLQNEIDNLPPQFRTILTLYHLDEMSYNEIAEILDLPSGTVKSYLFRARKLLKERLKSKYQQEELWQ